MQVSYWLLTLQARPHYLIVSHPSLKWKACVPLDVDSYIILERLKNTNVSPAKIIQTINSLKRRNYLMRKGKKGRCHSLEPFAEAIRATSCQDCSKGRLKCSTCRQKATSQISPGKHTSITKGTQVSSEVRENKNKSP